MENKEQNRINRCLEYEHILFSIYTALVRILKQK